MPLPIEYVVKETSRNLWRNWIISLAAVVTVALSMTLVGVSLLLRQEVDNATIQWQGGVSLAIFMNLDLSSMQNPQVKAIEQQLDRNPLVASLSFCNHSCAYAEFKKMFSHDSAIGSAINNPSQVPVSFRVKLKQASEADAVGSQFTSQPGVMKVAYAKAEIGQLLSLSHLLETAMTLFALGMLVSSVVLILNSIRLAIFSRRKEVSVMKLVGATNWFIRVPFMSEGLIQGVIGAAIGCGFTSLFISEFRKLVTQNRLKLFEAMTASTSETVITYVLLIVFGALVGAGGSAIALRRFLDV